MNDWPGHGAHDYPARGGGDPRAGMVQLWRPDGVVWFNRWGVEEDVNRRLRDGWKLLTVLPADKWNDVPTFIFQNRERLARS